MEHLESLKQQISERFNSPLLLSFGVSWLAWNYKIIVVLFSELEPLVKFEVIQRLYPEIFESLGRAVLFPASSALIFLLIYPFASRIMLKYNIWHHGLTLKVKAKAAEGRVLLPEEAKSMHEHYKSRIESLESEVERRTDIGVKHRDERDKAEALVVEGKLANQKLADELEAKLAALQKNNVSLTRSNGEFQAQLEEKTAAHAESMKAVLHADKLLASERAKVATLKVELEAATGKFDSLMRQFSQQPTSSHGKGLGALGVAPVVEPNALKGLQDFVDRVSAQSWIVNKTDDEK